MEIKEQVSPAFGYNSNDTDQGGSQPRTLGVPVATIGGGVGMLSADAEFDHASDLKLFDVGLVYIMHYHSISKTQRHECTWEQPQSRTENTGQGILLCPARVQTSGLISTKWLLLNSLI